jgi:uncharacterized membrane protein YfcA
MSVEHLALVGLAFILGGIFKGATGIGAPLIAIPLMALLVDVPFAVAVFLVPNIISNAWQSWRFRLSKPEGSFSTKFALSGMLGACVGTVVLAKFSGEALITSIALLILLYVAFRLSNPNWSLSWNLANRLVMPVGGIGGFFQGSTGLSAPVSVTYMSAISLKREEFIFTMSLYFFAMTLVQIPIQVFLGIMTLERFLYGLAAVVPLFIGLSIGGYLGSKISKSTFDKIIVVLLTLLSLRLLSANLFG